MSKAKFKTALMAVVMVVLSTFAALLLAEGVVRLFDIGPEFNPVYKKNFRLSENPILGYELVPGSDDRGDRISADGLRDRDYAVPKPEGVFRIVVLGDSVAYGHGVRQSQTYAKFMEADLRQAFPGGGFEVINFGVTGYNSRQVAEFARQKALGYQPDLIVYGYCLNDPQEYSLEMMNLLKQKEASRESGSGALGALAARSRLYLLVRYLLGGSSPAEQAGKNFRPVSHLQDPQWAALEGGGDFVAYFRELHRSDRYWGRVQQDLDDLREVGREAAAKVVLAIFPLLRDLDRYPLTDTHGIVAGAARERGFRVLDLLAAYRFFEQEKGLDDLALDSLHLTPDGHRFTAAVILDYLQRESLLPGADAQRLRRVLERDPAAADYLQPGAQ